MGSNARRQSAMLVNNDRLKHYIYQVELQITKLNQLEMYELLSHVPEQKRQAKTACLDLIEELSKIIKELEEKAEQSPAICPL